MRRAARLRALLAAVLAAALFAAPAAAQEGEPVVGAGSFTTAPIIEPGTYRDTVLPEEYLFYGVRVAPGQRLHVQLEAGMTPRELNDLGVISVQVNVHAPDRSKLSPSGSFSTVGEGSDPVDFTTEAALGSEEARTSLSEDWLGPGVYFLAIFGLHAGADEPSKAQIPVTFTLALEGTAQPDATPSPTPSPTPTATATPAVAEAGEDSSPAIAAGAGVGGLLLGVVGGIALRRRGR